MDYIDVLHDGHSFRLSTGEWLETDKELEESIQAIDKDEIYLSHGLKAKDFKEEVNSRYRQEGRPVGRVSYLNKITKDRFGYEYEQLITMLKKRINDDCIPLLTARRDLTRKEHERICMAASNGHVAAMFNIATSLSRNKDDNCLMWYSMAHNSKHVGGAYEMAVYLYNKGNILEAITCLVIAADGGCDNAFMSLFDTDLLIKMVSLDADILDSRLSQLCEASHNSSARYFKGVMLLLQNEIHSGKKILLDFKHSPKKPPSVDRRDYVFNNHHKIADDFLTYFLEQVDRKESILASHDKAHNSLHLPNGEVGLPNNLLSTYMDDVEQIRKMLFEKFRDT